MSLISRRNKLIQRYSNIEQFNTQEANSRKISARHKAASSDLDGLAMFASHIKRRDSNYLSTECSSQKKQNPFLEAKIKYMRSKSQTQKRERSKTLYQQIQDCSEFTDIQTTYRQERQKQQNNQLLQMEILLNLVKLTKPL